MRSFHTVSNPSHWFKLQSYNIAFTRNENGTLNGVLPNDNGCARIYTTETKNVYLVEIEGTKPFKIRARKSSDFNPVFSVTKKDFKKIKSAFAKTFFGQTGAYILTSYH